MHYPDAIWMVIISCKSIFPQSASLSPASLPIGIICMAGYGVHFLVLSLGMLY